MPRGDGTGPAGMGPRTGKGAGYCAGNATPGWMDAARGGLSGIGTLIGVGRRAAGMLPRLGRGSDSNRGPGGRNRRFQ